MQYYSAFPLNIASGVTTIQGTAGRPIMNGGFIGRNIGTGNDFFAVSARLSRTFQLTERLRLEGTAEAFNALNHPEFSSPDLSPTSSTFGRITSQPNLARNLQLGGRLVW